MVENKATPKWLDTMMEVNGGKEKLMNADVGLSIDTLKGGTSPLEKSMARKVARKAGGAIVAGGFSLSMQQKPVL